jgi:hypothetical protein
MQKVTTTKATHRGVEINVISERFDRQTMYSCTNSKSTGRVEVKWFPTQGEAIANERYEIDRILR